MKKLLMVIVLVVAFAIPTTAFATSATTAAPVQIYGSWCAIDFSKLTDQQKADLTDSFNQMMDLRKETINKMVADGAITKEQGDASIKYIDDMIKYRTENGFTGGYGFRGMGKGYRGFGRSFSTTPPAQ